MIQDFRTYINKKLNIYLYIYHLWDRDHIEQKILRPRSLKSGASHCHHAPFGSLLRGIFWSRRKCLTGLNPGGKLFHVSVSTMQSAISGSCTAKSEKIMAKVGGFRKVSCKNIFLQNKHFIHKMPKALIS